MRIATARGFGAGRLIEPGEPVPDSVPPGSWTGDAQPARRKAEGASAPSSDPFDHDGDNRPGGSKKQEGPDLPALRAEYKAVVGKRPFPGWGEDELRRRIAEAKG